MKLKVTLLFILFISLNYLFASDNLVIDDSFIPMVKNGKRGYMKNGNIIVPFKYDNLQYFKEGLALVSIGGTWSDEFGYWGGKWGFIDKTGKEVIPLIYDWTDREGFINEKARVGIDNKTGFIDKKGNFTPDED